MRSRRVRPAGRGAGGDPVGTLVGVGGGGGGGGRGGGGGGRGGGGGGAAGQVMMSPDGTSVYFQGSIGGGRGANATPARPFIDKVDIKTGDAHAASSRSSPMGLN